MAHGRNGAGRVLSLPDAAQQEQMLREAQEHMAEQARAQFRGLVSHQAGRIAAGLVGIPGLSDEYISGRAVSLARSIVIAANACQFPTREELGGEPEPVQED